MPRRRISSNLHQTTKLISPKNAQGADMKKKRYSPTTIVPRDYEIIRLCAALGGVESFDISTLLFTPAPIKGDFETRLQTQANSQKRLKLLYDRGFLDRIEQPSRRSDGTKYNIH